MHWLKLITKYICIDTKKSYHSCTYVGPVCIKKIYYSITHAGAVTGFYATGGTYLKKEESNVPTGLRAAHSGEKTLYSPRDLFIR